MGSFRHQRVREGDEPEWAAILADDDVAVQAVEIDCVAVYSSLSMVKGC
jgi:hypothetical protein